MRRTELLQEIRKMRFEEAYEGWNAGRLTQAEATEGAARDGRDAAQSARATAHAELTAIDSESAALAKATRATGFHRHLAG